MYKICSICNHAIIDNNFNTFFDEYTHKSCDDKIFDKIDKNIKIIPSHSINIDKI